MTIKASIVLGYECNCSCTFCYPEYKRKEGIRSNPTIEVMKQLKEGRRNGATMVDFLGGEPTIRKDLTSIVAFAKQIGYDEISITTNGKMLSYREYAEKLVDAGLNHVIFSIHGIGRIHDELTRVDGSFEQLRQAMQNIRSIDKKTFIATNTVMTRQNAPELLNIAIFNTENGVNCQDFIFPHPRGGSWYNFEETVPTLTEIEKYVEKLLSFSKKNRVNIAVRYLPVCYLFGMERTHLSELRTSLKELHLGPEFADKDVKTNRIANGKVKGPQCVSCLKNDICEGIWKEYAFKRGVEELRPIVS